MDDKKQLIEILKNSKDIVSYQPNARGIPFWGSDKRKFFIQDDNGHLTIHFDKIVDEIYKQGYQKIDKGSVVFKDSKIYLNEKHIGNIDFSPYDDIKALGFGNFEIIDKRKGFGTFVINELVAQNKNKYDLIYCFVDKENVSAIEFYKRVGKVHFDKINDKNQYYVTIYESVNQARNQAVKEFAERLKERLYNFQTWKVIYGEIDETLKEFINE